jgi:hypothetical protein
VSRSTAQVELPRHEHDPIVRVEGEHPIVVLIQRQYEPAATATEPRKCFRKFTDFVRNAKSKSPFTSSPIKCVAHSSLRRPTHLCTMPQCTARKKLSLQNLV